MSSELPLSGGVGFEIFDKQGLGATEQAQRVSYQRALQGELARTIGTLERVKQARVHLVLPESSLFRKDRQEATAAVSVTLEPGESLERQQILGVQRLIAAAVPGLTPERVVVTNHRGVTLSIASSLTEGAGAADSRLDVKRRIEEYVTRKVATLLDGAYGPGQALVTVDATVNFDASKRTTQDLVPAASAAGAVEGMVVRRRQTLNSAPEPILTNATDGSLAAPKPTNSSVEVEYEYGKRMEEVISAPGTVTRLSIGIIVPDAATDASKQRIKEIVRAAAGIDEARGDAVSVQTLADLGSNPVEAPQAGKAVEAADAVAEKASLPPRGTPAAPLDRTVLLPGALLVGFALLVLLAVRFIGSRRLSAAERDQLLHEIRSTLDQSAGQRSAGRS